MTSRPAPGTDDPPSGGSGRPRPGREDAGVRSRLVAIVLGAVLVGSVVSSGMVAAGTAPPSASFSPSVVHEERGDIATITVSTSQAGTVNVGGPSVGFWLQFGVGAGTTTVQLNTYEAPEGVGMIRATEGSIRNVVLRTDRPIRPLDVATYPMNVTIDGREQALGALVVTERRTGNATTLVAPQGVEVADLETGADVKSVATELDGAPVASGDWFVYHLNATGLDGFLVKEILGDDGEHVRLEFEERNPLTNADPNRFTGDEATKLVVDSEAEAFYLLVNTTKHGIEPGDVYDVTFAIDERNPLVTETESRTVTLRVAERRLNLDGGRRIEVENRTTLTGNTTLAPGSSIELRARHPGVPPILKTNVVTVTANRTVTATFDFSDVPAGLAFEIRAADPALSIPALKPEPATPTPTTTVNPPGTTLPTPFPTTAPVASTTSTTSTPYPTERPITPQPLAQSEGQPGVGIGSALLAAVLAVLLVVRRGGIDP